MIRLESGQPDQALVDISQAIEIAPDVGQFYYLRARCLLALKQEAAALDSIVAAVQRDPTCLMHGFSVVTYGARGATMHKRFMHSNRS